MNYALRIILTIIIFFSLPIRVDSYSNKTSIKIKKIYDGDTIQAKIDNNTFKIRFIGIDCMETSSINRAYMQAYKNNIAIEDVIKNGLTAKKYLELRINNSQKNDYYFDFKGIDMYGRALGIFYIGSTNINQELIDKKYCLP